MGRDRIEMHACDRVQRQTTLGTHWPIEVCRVTNTSSPPPSPVQVHIYQPN